ncbi:hypothetical protein AYO45_00125 [Gammaproteobacteria bacterium SCGC AG-212-F23]|nr:hypothetical protein AYO45_00125 [Gammaproteobacteria bacterium SCGC AG-212-F23]
MRALFLKITILIGFLGLTACAVGHGGSGGTTTGTAATTSYGEGGDVPDYVYRAPSARAYDALSSQAGAIRAGGGGRR